MYKEVDNSYLKHALLIVLKRFFHLCVLCLNLYELHLLLIFLYWYQKQSDRTPNIMGLILSYHKEVGCFPYFVDKIRQVLMLP